MGRLCSGAAVAVMMSVTSLAARQAPVPPRPAAVPETVQRVLANVGCHRPEGSPKQTITHGHFVRASQEDWAALCRSGESSFIYVVWGGTAQCPSIVASRPNKNYETSAGFQRELRTWGPDAILTALRSAEKPRKIKIDHDGIEDAMDGSASTIRYCLDRGWVSLQGSN